MFFGVRARVHNAPAKRTMHAIRSAVSNPKEDDFKGSGRAAGDVWKSSCSSSVSLSPEGS